MILVTLPDGLQLRYDQAVNISTVVTDIGLNSIAVAGSISFNGVDFKLVDLSFQIIKNATVKIITIKESEGLEIIRHSTAHLLAYAIKELFPEAKIAIGPVIDNGFYYDISCKHSITLDDLNIIEKKMHELSLKNELIIRESSSRNNALNFFKEIGESYKVEIISQIPESDDLSLYREGNFVDLCKGPHVPSNGFLKYFKLLKISGAYWRGDSNNEMLQRIYGTAWATKDQLNSYLKMLEEAAKRDHRKISKDLDLFHIQEEGPGLIFWHPKGWIIWQQIENYMRNVYVNNGYKEIKSPQLLDISLWKKTGHWDNYRENMFITHSENRDYALKPMNCPGHIQVFNSSLRSYKELPIRYGEFGQCHRNETSGSLHGLMRLRGFTQDDGHIFCAEEHLEKECICFTKLLQKVYNDFGFKDITYRVSTRPKKRIGSDDLWDQAENALINSLSQMGCEFDISAGEGAFYGPKIEYVLKDAIGRNWQCGTIQVDFSMPVRLKAEYVDAHDQRCNPVMLHRAILGSIERFVGVLIEHHAGSMPLWLAPVQIVICCISEQYADYANIVMRDLRKNGFRVEVDLRNEKINRKIREHSLQKVPYILVVGEKEKNDATLSIRTRGSKNSFIMNSNEFIKLLTDDICTLNHSFSS
ncbi:threonyl-tRNA synthetase [Candidatus Kinetoplastibacterium desouzaii TCC079E]|uniref:Threonine--tRNA ligase n=1 Tax=Candidatus Kinetoplastidibacterium desouzai TCC079E TaxID=1208919 RepID=M1M3G3_9PROT|nr:threonine--tRNA ligase [Candidatus Kinetoplastibacterium desouzaii]AGF46780.1 threonyl-tRNA synthetase [Candidatus Kinetoplastibacterium desouzaii TCC079E]